MIRRRLADFQACTQSCILRVKCDSSESEKEDKKARRKQTLIP